MILQAGILARPGQDALFDIRDWQLIEGKVLAEDRGSEIPRPWVPMQTDGHSCGVMALMNIHYILHDETPRYPFEAEGRNFDNMRKRIALSVLDQAINPGEYKRTRARRGRIPAETDT